ncbi:MAG: TetR/AcrR family transcriptional regulator [Dehalococcoidia bacterium]|nr:TetR/AcrR family transcriptional regulator [Dehalococcoidia bacterium]
MTSLRERQKERRSREILDAAEELISDKGFEETSVEEIADRAEVGIATVYNYFGTKIDLLHAMLERYIEAEAALGAEVIRNPPPHLVDGMTALFGSYLDGMAGRCSKRLLQEFYAMAISRQFAYGEHTYRMKMRFLDQCRTLVAHYKSTGQLRTTVTAEEAAMVCYSAVTFPFAQFALGIDVDADSAKRGIHRSLSLLYEGIGTGEATPESFTHER